MKLTLRDLFAVVTIAALALGWWVDRESMKRECFKFKNESIESKKDYADLWNRWLARERAEKIQRELLHGRYKEAQEKAIADAVKAAIRDQSSPSK